MISSNLLQSHRSGRLRVAGAVLAVVALTAGCGGKPAVTSTLGTAQPAVATGAPTAAAPTSTPGPTSSVNATKAAVPKPLKSGWGVAAGASGAIRVRDVSLVARSRVAKIKIYRTATGAKAVQSLASPLPSGGPLVFLVQERKGDRLRVLLPVRPNESQGWVRAADVTLAQLDYRITVSARAHQLKLYRSGKLVMTEPVGLGKGTTPTPGGVFYLKELLKPSDPKGSYGPYAYGLSGYSDVLHEFLGGNGQIGIHGTNDPGSVGRDVSHGCIRMRNAAITKLAKMLPLGVPVQMIA